MESPPNTQECQGKTFNFPPSLSHFNVTPQDWLSTHTDTQVLVTSTLVFAHNSTGSDRLLLIQRSSSDYFPDCWEIPGGSVDLNGETILEAAARELYEEAGLTVSRFVRYMTSTRFFIGSQETGKWWEKFIFEVEVAEAAPSDDGGSVSQKDRVDAKVSLDEKEHQAWLWASEEEVRNERAQDITLTFMTAEQQGILLSAFEARKGPVASAEVTHR